MNISDLKAALQTVHEVIHPLDGPTGFKITLASAEHPATKRAIREALDRRMRTKGAPSLDEDEAEGIKILVARTLGWEGLEDDGEPVPFTPEAAQALYSQDGHLWLRKQLMAALGDETLFFSR